MFFDICQVLVEGLQVFVTAGCLVGPMIAGTADLPTPTPEPTATATATPEPTATPTGTLAPSPTPTATATPTAAPPPPTATPGPLFMESCNLVWALNETGSETQSPTPTWWLSSGGRLLFDGNLCTTLQGDQPTSNPWRAAYANANPIDTDNGLHPQNLFRWVKRGTYSGNYAQTTKFKLVKYNVSASPNRNQSNGILHFMRYLDQENLYYAGVRVDGRVTVKRKNQDDYTDLLSVAGVFPGNYHASANPNLIPTGVWMTLRTEIRNLQNGNVEIKVYLDKGDGAGLQLKGTVVDNDAASSQSISTNRGKWTVGGKAGLRTDFGDYLFDDIKIEMLP